MTVTTAPAPVLFHPGFLLEPLGWVLSAFANPIATDRELLTDLCSINKPRLHLLAIGAVHAPKPIQASVVRFLIRETPQEVMRRLGLSWPIGFSAVLNKLPGHIIEADLYQHLLTLLADPTVAKLLHHRREIDEALIRGLVSLPAPLRTLPVLGLLSDTTTAGHLGTGLQALAKRAGISFGELVAGLAACRQRAQAIAFILDTVEQLPLPDALPPGKVGPFRRIDRAQDIRALAKAWANCLADHIHDVGESRIAIYLNNTEPPHAAAMVVRYGRLGWLLDDIKGLANTAIEPAALARYQHLFVTQGFGLAEELATIRAIMLTHRWDG